MFSILFDISGLNFGAVVEKLSTKSSFHAAISVEPNRSSCSALPVRVSQCCVSLVTSIAYYIFRFSGSEVEVVTEGSLFLFKDDGYSFR